MPRVISFLVLLAIVLLVGAIFFQVMAQFFVPLFLACVLLVVFEPLHRWMTSRVPDRPRMAAAQIEHRAILAALVKGNPEAAVKAAGRHRDDTLKSWAEIVRRSETVLPES